MSFAKINGLLLKKMIIAGANELNKNKQLVDSLNVFPVPDGDTGINMSLTVLAAAKECEKSNSLSASEIANLLSNGSLRGARGNSGVILSQIFRGFSKGIDGKEEIGVHDISDAIKRACETAYKAVMKPKEGTILSVVRACAEASDRIAEETEDIGMFLKEIINVAKDMLDKTPDMLPVLKQAGVVDAGGQGFLFILEGAYSGLGNQEDITLNEPISNTTVDFSLLNTIAGEIAGEEITFGYCTEFFINTKNTNDSDIMDLKSYLSTIGDSLVVVNDNEIIKVHVHTDHPGLAIEKGLKIGMLDGLKIDNMKVQHASKIDFKNDIESHEIGQAENSEKIIGFISVSMGKGISNVFKNLGVDIIVEGGQTMNPSIEDILNAIDKISAKNVFILPNNSNIILAAKQAAGLSKNKNVYVIPTKTVPQGITAMVNYGGISDVEEALETMKAGIDDVSTLMVTYAVRDTIFGDNEILEGDIIGMIEGDIEVISKDVAECAKKLIDKSIGEDSGMVSIYYGKDVSKESAEDIFEYISQKFAGCEVEVLNGEQPLYYYIISVE